MKPTYFDFTVKDLDKAKTFFERVFNWRFEKFPMPYEYYRIQAGAEDEPGIDGGIGAIGDTRTAEGKPLTQVTIPVPSVDDCIERVEEAGGLLEWRLMVVTCRVKCSVTYELAMACSR